MPNLYARATPLPNVTGRVDYISSAHRQERLLAAYDGAADLLDGQFWRQLAKESQASFDQFGVKVRDGKELKCCEGREIMIQLSNALLNRMSPEEIVKTVVDEFRDKLGLTVAAGLHLKHYADGPDNLHVHVVFPERQLLKEPAIKIADRALFFDAQGKRRYKKSEILDENKQLLPGCRIVKKGEIYEQRYFGSVDPKYSSKAWLRDVKTNVILQLRNGKLRGDIEITEFDYSTGKLPQQHIGNKIRNPKIRERIRQYNIQVIEYNRMVDAGYINAADLRAAQIAMSRTGKRNELIPVVTTTIQRKRNENVIRAQRDWKVQNMLDSIRLARELGVSNASDFEDKKGELGRTLGQAKRKYAATVQQYGEGSIEAKMAEAELIKAKKVYADTMRMIEDGRQIENQNEQRQSEKTNDDRR